MTTQTTCPKCGNREPKLIDCIAALSTVVLYRCVKCHSDWSQAYR